MELVDCRKLNWFICQNVTRTTGYFTYFTKLSLTLFFFSDSHWPSHIYLNITKPPVKLFSPNFPAKYPSMLDKNVVISTEKDQIIIIEWDAFSIEAEKNCSYDKVVITELVRVQWATSVDKKSWCFLKILWIEYILIGREWKNLNQHLQW